MAASLAPTPYPVNARARAHHARTRRPVWNHPRFHGRSPAAFKTFMVYRGHALHGLADRDAERRLLMVGEEAGYAVAPFEFIMRAASRIRPAHLALAPYVSVSLRREIAEILNAYAQRASRGRSQTGRITATFLPARSSTTAGSWWGPRGRYMGRPASTLGASPWASGCGPTVGSSTAIHRFSRIPNLPTSCG